MGNGTIFFSILFFLTVVYSWTIVILFFVLLVLIRFFIYYSMYLFSYTSAVKTMIFFKYIQKLIFEVQYKEFDDIMKAGFSFNFIYIKNKCYDCSNEML